MATLFVISILLHSLNGHAESLTEAEPETIGVRSFQLPAGRGTVFVVIRKDGHVEARPYIIEVRADCGKTSQRWQDLEVSDSRSACDVAPDSPSFIASKGEISVLVRDVSAAKMEAQMRMTARSGEGLVCKAKGRTEIISTSDYCK